MSAAMAVLLAAGAGTRFGGDKLLAPLPVASHGVPAGTPIADGPRRKPPALPRCRSRGR